jgi:hypothetical protein
MNQKQNITINNDLMIEIHHNPNLTYKPFQLRIYGYESYYDYRLDPNDMLNLAENLADFVFDKTDLIDYNDYLTGLPRLWQYRRNEAIKKLEEFNDGMS